MLETSTSGLMSGDGKTERAPQSTATAPVLDSTKDYKHHNTGEDNGDSHLKALLIHHEVIVPITGGKLDLGTWQRIFYAEFDGQRDKRVIVKVMGE
jgi:secondary thiamine-phosphate synthase enzyme